MRRTGDYFGGKAVELAGLISRPDYQAKGIGTSLVGNYIDTYSPKEMIAYTRNPALLRVLGNVSMTSDVLAYDNPELIAAHIPYATVGEGNILYHIGRYAPHGLYGKEDPADKPYNGVALKERCELLADPNNALAVMVDLTRRRA